MAINYSKFDAVMAKVNARKAELNKTAKDGWDRLANSSKARKEFQAELDEAKQGMYDQTPGGTYKSFLQYRDPLRGDRKYSPAAYLQMKKQGNTDEEIRRAGYQGETPSAYTGAGSGPAKGGVKSRYVQPKDRTVEEWAEQDPAEFENRYGWVGDYNEAMDNITSAENRLSEAEERYESRFNTNVENGGGIPASGRAGSVADAVKSELESYFGKKEEEEEEEEEEFLGGSSFLTDGGSSGGYLPNESEKNNQVVDIKSGSSSAGSGRVSNISSLTGRKKSRAAGTGGNQASYYASRFK